MKKNIIYLALVLFSFTINSCTEDVEIWDSNTLGYSGTFYWEQLSEDMVDTYYAYDDYGQHLMIYNTSDNVENEIWIEDVDIYPLKSKFSLQGTPESFMSKSMDFADLSNNLFAIEDATPSAKPTALNEEEVVEEVYAIRAAILEGKILPKAGTTISGNPVDSLYIKIKIFSGTVKYTSYAVPVPLRADPEVEEFAWEYNSATNDATLEATEVISGFRKTGFSEDDY